MVVGWHISVNMDQGSILVPNIYTIYCRHKDYIHIAPMYRCTIHICVCGVGSLV
jgi:hypothetical protein